MNKVDQGGPAFPIPLNQGDRYEAHAICDGMTLRDYFAAQALSTVSAYNAEDVTTWGAEDFAKHAYAIADAMIRERNGGN